jgi:hypothetical protein
MPKSSSFYLTIPQPCQQAWEEMTPDANGRFCSNCNKTVMDFTNLSDEELLAMIRQSTTKVCGRFQTSQLDRPLYYAQKQHQSTLLPAVMITSALVAGVAANSTARSTDTNVATANLAGITALTTPPVNTGVDHITAQDTLHAICGKVFENNSQRVVSWASIRIEGTSYGTTTDQDGSFRLSIPDSLASKEITLIFAAVGLEMQKLKLTSASDSRPMEVRMRNAVTLGATTVVVVSEDHQRKATLWQKVKRLFR